MRLVYFNGKFFKFISLINLVRFNVEENKVPLFKVFSVNLEPVGHTSHSADTSL